MNESMKLIIKSFNEIILDVMVLSLIYCKIQIKMENISRPSIIQQCQSYSAVLNHYNLRTSAVLYKRIFKYETRHMEKSAGFNTIHNIPKLEPLDFSAVAE